MTRIKPKIKLNKRKELEYVRGWVTSVEEEVPDVFHERDMTYSVEINVEVCRGLTEKQAERLVKKLKSFLYPENAKNLIEVKLIPLPDPKAYRS